MDTNREQRNLIQHLALKFNFMTTAWHHLPSAVHIDRILADLKANPIHWEMESWVSDWNTWGMVYNSAWDVVWNAARIEIYNAVVSAAWEKTNNRSYIIGRNALLALIAWPESAVYLDLSTDQVRMIMALGDHRAILLLPAVMAFEMSRGDVV